MWGLVRAEGIFTLFLFWELTSVTSYLLIGTEDRSAAARSAATRAFLVTRAGGLALLAGLVPLGSTTGERTISGLLASPGSGRLAHVALVLVLVGTFTGAALRLPGVPEVTKLLVAPVLQFVTAPVAAHPLGTASVLEEDPEVAVARPDRDQDRAGPPGDGGSSPTTSST